MGRASRAREVDRQASVDNAEFDVWRAGDAYAGEPSVARWNELCRCSLAFDEILRGRRRTGCSQRSRIIEFRYLNASEPAA